MREFRHYYFANSLPNIASNAVYTQYYISREIEIVRKIYLGKRDKLK